jgi:hypothetical protein
LSLKMRRGTPNGRRTRSVNAAIASDALLLGTTLDITKPEKRSTTEIASPLPSSWPT